MNIDLRQGWGNIDGECPKCKTELELIGLPRWSIEAICPNCSSKLQIDFDFIVGEDGDEYDFYTLNVLA